MMKPRPVCLRLDRHEVCRAFSLACAKTGKRIAARIAMIAITTSSSMRVKPLRLSMFLAPPTRIKECNDAKTNDDSPRSQGSGDVGAPGGSHPHFGNDNI